MHDALSFVNSVIQDIAMAIALANSLKDETRLQGELAELQQVRDYKSRAILNNLD